MTRSIALIGGGADIGAAPELRQLLPPGTELVAYPSKVSAFPHTALEVLLQEIGHAEAAFSAAEDGCSAVVIDSVGDYGLAAMRASLPIPSFGAGEAGTSEASAGGRSFAIVTVWPASMNFVPEGRLRAYGHAQACRAIFNVGADTDLAGPDGPADYLARVKEGERTVLDGVLRAIEAAASQGAGAVMLGCTCMSGIAARLGAASRIPVINPLAAAVRAAVGAGPVSQPSVRIGRREMLRAMADAVAGGPAEACPVCIGGVES